MPDLEKVIKELENAPNTVKDGFYFLRITHKLRDDAIALLKEQEATKPKTGHWIFESAYCEAWSHTCSECGKRMTTAINMYANWCWNCGAKMEGR